MYVKWAIGGYHKEAIYSPITSKRLEAINHRCLVAKQGGGKKSEVNGGRRGLFGQKRKVFSP